MLNLQPVSQAEANAFVRRVHRHHPPLSGMKFCIGVADTEKIRGVAIVTRPLARMLDDSWTLEVARVATDGAHNACSMLYGACWRATQALGYRRLFTYTLPEEGGSSLRASGWICDGEAGGGSWNRAKRLRIDKHPVGVKLRWRKESNATESRRFTVDIQENQMSLFG